MEDGIRRERSKRKLIRVTMPNGKVVCYKNVTDTVLETLRLLGEDTISKITLQLCNLPIVSKEIYPKYKEYMKPIGNGWYFNSQSNSDSKYLQLKAINDQMGLGLKIELGTDFETQEKTDKGKRIRSKDKLLVKFPDGEYFANDSAIDTYLEVIWHIGIDALMRKGLSWGDKPLITTAKLFNTQVQVDRNRWIIVPNTTRDKVKLLRVIGAMMHLKLEVQAI